MKEPAPGVIITGKYRLERPLASGGMGSVWVARHVELGVPVAIKFIGPQLAASADGRMRFEREAKAAALLQSPYVVSVQDYGVDDHLPYIVMELMRGEDLEDRLRRLGRLSLYETSHLLTQMAKGLRRAHEMGIIHRDLKPRNLFLARNDDEETVKILDFGIAKALAPTLAMEVTTTGNIMGSPFYMSPEQIRGAKDIDLRTDLWSLGVVLFQMLTGTLPFRGEVVGDVIGKILADPIPQATHLAPDLPLPLDGFFGRALARDRAQRFQSAREMADGLADISRSSIPVRMSLEDTVPVPLQMGSETQTMPGAITPGSVLIAPPDDARTSTIPLALARSPLERAQHTPSGIQVDGQGARHRPAWAAFAAAVLTMAMVLATAYVFLLGKDEPGSTAHSPTADQLGAPSVSTAPSQPTPTVEAASDRSATTPQGSPPAAGDTSPPASPPAKVITSQPSSGSTKPSPKSPGPDNTSKTASTSPATPALPAPENPSSANDKRDAPASTPQPSPSSTSPTSARPLGF